ncbi:MAG TPA: hypothetical protein ENK60_06805 [Anaerolineae bacterium]|nr:hypothetical protein [Anaerolineae bacterium]
MLHAILHELQTASGPLTLRQLSRKLGVQESALEGMIQFWVRKGRLVVDDGAGGLSEMRVCHSIACGLRACPGPGACPLTLKPPIRFHLSS